jgi:hypothetical protein
LSATSLSICLAKLAKASSGVFANAKTTGRPPSRHV